MLRAKKLLACSLSFVLCFSLMGVPAYADEPASTENEVNQQEGSVIETPEEPSQEPVQDGTSEGVSADDASVDGMLDEDAEKNPEAKQDTSLPTDSEAGAEDVENQEEADTDAIRVAAADAVEFVYVDESVVSLGQEQNIALGLLDETASIEYARLDLKCLDNDKVIELEATTLADNAALFAKTFEADDEAAAYQLMGVRYEIGGATYYADLTDVDGDELYTFDVVTQSVADAVKDSGEVSEDGDVSAFTVEDDGSLVATESVEAAIQTADADGVQDTEAEESIVDEEMLELGITGEEDMEAAEGSSEDASDDGIAGFFSNVFGSQEAWAAASSARENYLFVAIDPGHGGSDGGAQRNGLVEKNINLSIAQYCYNELTTYTGVTPYMMRTSDEYVGLQARVNRAVSFGADVFVSIHINSGGGTGAEVWVPNNSSYNYGAHTEGYDLGSKIQNKLAALGLANRGVKIRNSERVNGEGPFYYPDGSIQDYYTVIEASREAGIPGIIVEHAFIDNANDASKLAQDSFRKQLGVADASGIAQKYSLVKDSTAKSQSLVQGKGHSSGYGWLGAVYDQKVIGTTGKARGLEAFQASLTNAAASAGGITYRSYVGSGWQDWVSNGATSGTIGKATALQAVQIKLTGAAANKYDVYYRVHVSGFGWLGWAKNGASAGSSGYNYNAEAVEIAVVAKGAAAPGSTATPYKVKTETVSYQAHVSSIGWQGAVSSGSTAGTTGRALSIEALKVSIANQVTSGGVQYNIHCSGIGWQGWRSNGAIGGTTGQARQTEAIQIKLTGEMANKYDVYYRAHSAGFGWLGWAKNGETAGTEGFGYSMQAIQVKLVKKGSSAPGSTSNHNQKALIGYQTHVSSIGWQARQLNGATAGTSGRSLAVEALTINLLNQAYSGDVQYNIHCSGIGWQGWRSNGAIGGTTGQARQTEAIQIKLTGEMANKYDVYYRVHAQGFGWLDWAKNGASAGSAGYGYRMEAIQITLVNKGESAPGATASPYKQKSATSKSAIMGNSQASVQQMVRYFNSTKNAYPSVYASKGAATITQFCTILREEAIAEGVRAEVLFCQAMKETGWLQFGGSVKVGQCNFGGIGATSPTVGGASFADVRTGLRAQAQHLKAYASTAPLKNKCVDPRFDKVTRGSAPNLENLNGKWAVPGTTYGQDILAMITTLIKY